VGGGASGGVVQPTASGRGDGSGDGWGLGIGLGARGGDDEVDGGVAEVLRCRRGALGGERRPGHSGERRPGHSSERRKGHSGEQLRPRERGGGGKGAGVDARPEVKLRWWSESTKTRRSCGTMCSRVW
jgi:hypothetical protein